ncbi:SH3 domain-containing protein [Pseudomonas aeruginosa]|uniref:SH3 domain-containing protein n=1 Tax=Pseudomonas aeruginosa TaxID=287 RepID=UPI0008FBBC65|nr:SH3 domain-containing protein [Pseudomonas aeruginosa]
MEGASPAFEELLASDLATLANLGERQRTIATLLRASVASPGGRLSLLSLDSKIMLGDLAFTLGDLAPSNHDIAGSPREKHQVKLHRELGPETIALIWSITSMGRSLAAVDRVAEVLAANDAQRNALLFFGFEWLKRPLRTSAALKSWGVIKKLFPPETLPTLLLAFYSVVTQVAPSNVQTAAQVDDRIRDVSVLVDSSVTLEKLVVETLNVRLGPGTEYPKVGTPLPPGAIVSVVQQSSDGWSFIRRHGRTGDTGGWVSSRFLQDIPTPD